MISDLSRHCGIRWRGTGEMIRGTGKMMRCTGEMMRGTGKIMRGTDEMMRGTGEMMHDTGEPYCDCEIQNSNKSDFILYLISYLSVRAGLKSIEATAPNWVPRLLWLFKYTQQHTAGFTENNNWARNDAWYR
jgi:hypothetical protein